MSVGRRLRAALMTIAVLVGEADARAAFIAPTEIGPSQAQTFARAGAQLESATTTASRTSPTTGEAPERERSRLRGLALAASSPLQTLVTMWLVSSVQALRDQRLIAHLQGRSLTAGQELELGLNLAPQLFNSFDVYFGMVGGALAGGAGSLALRGAGISQWLAPLRDLRAVTTVPLQRLALRQMMASGALQIATGFAFEITVQLREEAIAMLTDVNDVQKARTLSFWKVMTGGGDADEIRVFNQLNGNIAEILSFRRPELVGALLYNAYRLRILRASFAYPMAIGAAAGTAAWTMAPSGPWGIALTFVGGVLGGVAGLYVPQSVKERTDRALLDGRMRFNESQLVVNQTEIRERLRMVGGPFWRGPTPENQRELRQLFERRKSIRQTLMTAWMEQLFMTYATTMETSAFLERMQAADAAGAGSAEERAAAVRQARARRDEAQALAHETLQKISGLYRREYEAVMPLIDRFENARVGREVRPMPEECQLIIASAMEPLGTFHEHLLVFAAALDPVGPGREALSAQGPELMQSLIQVSNLQMIQWYFRGFDEDVLLSVRQRTSADPVD